MHGNNDAVVKETIFSENIIWPFEISSCVFIGSKHL